MQLGRDTACIPCTPCKAWQLAKQPGKRDREVLVQCFESKQPQAATSWPSPIHFLYIPDQPPSKQPFQKRGKTHIQQTGSTESLPCPLAPSPLPANMQLQSLVLCIAPTALYLSSICSKALRGPFATARLMFRCFVVAAAQNAAQDTGPNDRLTTHFQNRILVSHSMLHSRCMPRQNEGAPSLFVRTCERPSS